MSIGNLLDFILKKENKKIQYYLGFIFTIIPIAFFIGGGFNKPINGHGIILSSGWFREIFSVGIIIIFLMGIIFLLSGFSKRKNK